MSREPPSSGANENPGPDFSHETTDGSFLPHGQANHQFHPSFLLGDDDIPGPGAGAASLAGRRDIDTAMLEALKNALAGDAGGRDAVPAASVRDERGAIDTAVLDALRRAMIEHPRSRDG